MQSTLSNVETRTERARPVHDGGGTPPLHLRLGSKPLHVGIIMDGNGRWATRLGKPRAFGHEAGIKALRRTIEAAPAIGIGTLTVFAFSADNWRRPPQEVDALMVLLRTYLDTEAQALIDAGVRLQMIGRRDRLPDDLAAAIEAAETATSAGTKLCLRARSTIRPATPS